MFQLLEEESKPSLLEKERLKFLSEFDDEWKMLERKLLEKGDGEGNMERLEENDSNEKKLKKHGLS